MKYHFMLQPFNVDELYLLFWRLDCVALGVLKWTLNELYDCSIKNKMHFYALKNLNININ